MDIKKLNMNGISKKIKEQLIRENDFNTYTIYFDVDKGDKVVDIGSFIGTFTYSILDKKPEHCWVVEPAEKYFKLLYDNLKGYPVSFINKAISDQIDIDISWNDDPIQTVKGTRFKDFIKDNLLYNINFLKIDCEGGEYDIFNEENIPFLKNVDKIACEFHLTDKIQKEKFRYFRDNILKKFENFNIRSVDMVDIKWSLFNDYFINYYKEILIYSDNRK